MKERIERFSRYMEYKGLNDNQECKDWIDLNRGRKETYFGDYAGGTVSIICNEDNETVYEEDIL